MIGIGIAGIVAAGAAGTALAWAARPSRLRSTGDRALHRLGPGTAPDGGVYVYRGHFSNSAAFVTRDGVLLVDTQVSPQAARHLRACLGAVTGRPVTHVVNTHYHGDHTGGNGLFPEAEIIATGLTARYIVERDGERLEYARKFGLEIQEVHPTAPPTRTFEGRLDITLGGERFEVLTLGRVETPDACVVHWPARRAVACGDGVATWDYPYLGVPFMDEGLRDDGEWIGFLGRVKDLEPEILIGGHGPPIVGREKIAARLDLLISLYGDLLSATRRELRAGTPVPELVEKVDRELARYRERKDLKEAVTGQRFAIYRCVNNLSPERAGRGWWDDLRPSVVRRADRERARIEVEGLGTGSPSPGSASGAKARSAELLARGERPLAHALLDLWLERNPGDAAAWGALADLCFDGGLSITPRVDGTEYVALANDAAKRALAIDPGEPLARLTLGMSRVLGGMVLAQPMASGIADIEHGLASPLLTSFQRRKGAFFLGKAHQYEERPAESDAWLRQALPRWARPVFPVVRERMRCTP